MTEDPRETAARLRRMMEDGYDPTDFETEFLTLMDRRAKLQQDIIDTHDRVSHGVTGEQFTSMGLQGEVIPPGQATPWGISTPEEIVSDVKAIIETMDESHNIKTPVGRIMHAGVTTTGRAMLAQQMMVLIAGERVGMATMEMTQADLEARLDIMDMGLNIDMNVSVGFDAPPPAMGKTTFVNKRLLERPAFAPDGNRKERRSGGKTKSRQHLKGLR